MTEGLKSALKSIWGNKVRSLLTVLGIVIGVTSVVTLVSLGQGLKNEVTKLIQGFGSNIVFVVGGKIDTDNPQAMQSVNPANFISGDVITNQDLNTIEKTDGVEYVSPMSLVPGSVKYEDKLATPIVFGTNPEFSEAVNVLKVSEGRFFTDQDDNFVALVDKVVKKNLVGDGDIVDKTIQVANRNFKVIGVLTFDTGESVFGNQFSNMVVIPQSGAKILNDNQEKILRVVVKISDNYDVNKAKSDIKDQILKNHNNEEDFSVLTQDDMLSLLDTLLSLVTTMVSAIAAISLVVGGIGIMNIMLVTVTERTKEIGLRKAVGATKFEIGLQFLIEAVIITLLGGLIALIISFIFGQVVAAQTSITPDITPSIILIALGVSTVVGIIFGLWPALRAAKKDPIEALHYE